MYIIQVGIEHLRTGLEIEASGNVTFHYHTPTIFMACSLQPFSVYWPVKRIRLQAQYQVGYKLPTYSHDDIVVPKVELVSNMFYYFELRDSDGNDCTVYDCVIEAPNKDAAWDCLEASIKAEYPHDEPDGDGGTYHEEEGGIVVSDPLEFSTEGEAKKECATYHSKWYAHILGGNLDR